MGDAGTGRHGAAQEGVARGGRCGGGRARLPIILLSRSGEEGPHWWSGSTRRVTAYAHREHISASKRGAGAIDGLNVAYSWPASAGGPSDAGPEKLNRSAPMSIPSMRPIASSSDGFRPRRKSCGCAGHRPKTARASYMWPGGYRTISPARIADARPARTASPRAGGDLGEISAFCTSRARVIEALEHVHAGCTPRTRAPPCAWPSRCR